MSRLLWHILLEIAVAVPLALFLRKYVLMFALVKGRSMLDTLADREFVLARPLHRKTKIERFDIVLCRYPNRKELFVKRVVALPGERVALEAGTLMIDGEPVEENFALRRTPRAMAERELGADEYFVMGDNRLSSHDSRGVGPLCRDMIVAKVRCVLFPPKRMRRLR